MNNNNSKKLIELKLRIDYTLAVIAGITLWGVTVFPPEDTVFPVYVLPLFLLACLWLHIAGLRRGNKSFVRWAEYAILSGCPVMWYIVWANGNLPVILLPGVLAFTGAFALERLSLLVVYSSVSVLVLLVSSWLHPAADFAIFFRALVSLIGVIAVLFYLRDYIQLLNQTRVELEQKQRFLEVEMEKFDSVCKQLNMVFWQLNLATWRLTFNHQFAERWNLKVGGELEFSTLKTFMHRYYVDFHEEAINRVLAEKTVHTARYQAPVGEREGRWFELTYSPVFGRQGEIVAINVANIEITRLMLAEGEMAIKNAELVRQQQRESNLYAVIGHELRTPAAILKMMLEQESRGLGQIDRKLFSTTVDNLLAVVDTLRTVAQPDKIAQQTYTNELLSDLIGNQIAILQTLALDAGIILRGDYSKLNNRPVLVMAGPLKQLLSNLIKNAIIHSGGSKVVLSAESSFNFEAKKCLVLRVDDDGKGIPPDQIKRLFEAYERGAGAASGTGLGLYISREIARLMGGDLQYEQSALGGACFRVEFCLELGSQEGLAQSADELESSDRLGTMSVLVVEDDPAILQMTAALLVDEVAELRVAKNGLQALEILSNTQVDLVLTDIFMPEMTGIALVKTMREREYVQPVIGLTAATLGQETEELLQAGAQTVLNKPINIKALRQFLSQLNE